MREGSVGETRVSLETGFLTIAVRGSVTGAVLDAFMVTG